MSTFADYRAIKAINYSTLKHMERSPAHYRAAVDGEMERPSSPALAFGSLVHALTFEPETVDRLYAVEEVDRRTKAGKERAAFLTDTGRELVKPDVYARAESIARRVRTSPLVAPYLTGARHELTVEWTHPATGLRCKGRLDWIHEPTRTLLDLKTARDIGRRFFGRQAASLGYVGQLGGMYRDACRYGLGWEPARILIVAVESAPPFDLAVYQLDSQAIEAGEALIESLLSRVAECEASGTWPGAHPEVETLDVPGWYYGDGGDAEIVYDTDTNDSQEF